MFKAINLKKMFASVLIIGLIGAAPLIIASGAFAGWNELNLPDLAVPLNFLIIAWLVMFALLGIALYFVQSSSSNHKKSAASRFWLQMFFIFVWPILLFNLRAFGFAAIWMLITIAFIGITIKNFSRVSKGAAYLFVPYLLLCLYLLYLNYGIFMLN